MQIITRKSLALPSARLDPALLERLRNVIDIFSGRRAARVRGRVMLTAIGAQPDETYEIKPRNEWRGNAPEWTKYK